MKRLFIAGIVMIGLAAQLHAQQKPHYTQYVVNPFVINPAITGIHHYTDLKTSV